MGHEAATASTDAGHDALQMRANSQVFRRRHNTACEKTGIRNQSRTSHSAVSSRSYLR